MKLNWGKSIFLFFVIFISLAIVFIVFAYKHRNDLVTSDYYEKGADYTRQIEINKRSFIYTDRIKIRKTEESLILILSPQLTINSDSLFLHFYSPADKKKDYKVAFPNVSDSLFVEQSNLEHGRYILKISWQMNRQSYYLEKDLFIE